MSLVNSLNLLGAVRHKAPRLAALRSLSTSAASQVIGVRKEDKNRWERRAPLAPEHVKQLTEQGYQVLVEASDKRIFPDVAYEKAGAKIVTDLNSADLILGVKEVPIPKLIPQKSYLFFSHTHKAQPYNMPMLDAILEKKIRLMDYELLTDDKGVRIVKFGTFAGYAGMIDTLCGLGQRLLGLGQSSPFLNIGMSYTYPNLKEAKRAVSLVGQEIKEHGNPKRFDPMVFVFTGDGAVSKGAQEVFHQLPHKYITPAELKEMFATKKYDSHVVYALEINDVDYIRRKDGKKFERNHYRAHPEEHYSVFHEEIAPYATVIVNGIYWDAKYPRLLTLGQAQALLAKPDNRLVIVGDISCDIDGSMEFTKKASTIDNPFFLYGRDHTIHNNVEGDGIMVMSIDNLPTELAAESSNYFGNSLKTLIPKMVASKEFDKLEPVIKRAVITNEGKLTPKYEYISELRKKNNTIQVKDNSKKKVLMLGAGMVAEPVVDAMMERSDVSFTIASLLESDGRKLAKNNPGVKVTGLDIANKQMVGELVRGHDLVISLVPATFHPSVAEMCIENKKNMVTASYISPAMQSLHDKATKAGVTIMNEIGLDPGIDHLSAMKIIDEVKHEGGKILSFSSVCGGLPAPEASDNPLGYKFSWSPRGVLSAGLNASKALRNGKLVTTPQGKLFDYAEKINIHYPGFDLECLPNRDSTIYSKLYGIEDAHTVFRGTLRFRGFSELMGSLGKLGLFNEAEDPALKSNATPTWRQMLAQLTGEKETASDNEFRDQIAKTLGLEGDQEKANRIFDGIRRLGLLSATKLAPRGKLIDSLCAHLEKELSFKEGERDLVILHHDFLIQRKNGDKENLTSTLISYGTPGGYSAMAKTVGLPTALAGYLILDGKLKTPGVLAPMTKDIYEPLLQMLEAKDVRFVEKSVRVQ